MKAKFLSFSLFSLTAVSSFFVPSITPSAMAGCVGVSTGIQIAIDGASRPNQSNRVNRQFDDNCHGNSATSTSTQICRSDGQCSQSRTVNQRIGGGSNRTGVKTPNIEVDVHVPVHVKKPKAPSFNR